MSDVTVLIEIKPYLKKYLLKVYGGEECKEPIRFPKGNDYNRMLVHALQKPPKDFKPCFDRLNTIEVVLPYNNLKNIRTFNYLSREDKIKFRKEVDADFTADYKKYISDTMKSENLNRKEATILCIKMYDINENEITFDAFYKNIYRKSLLRTAIFSFSLF